LHATKLVISGLGIDGGAAPDVRMFDVDIWGSQASNPMTSNLIINTDGSVLVEGNVDVTSAGAGDSLTINAGQNIEVNTDTGSIRITDSTDQLAGTLNLNAANVWIADQSILTKLEANPD